MQIIIAIGSAVSLAGLAGLIWCIVMAMQAKRQGLSDDAMRARLQQVVVLNMAALGVSALGLMLVVAGIVLA